MTLTTAKGDDMKHLSAALFALLLAVSPAHAGFTVEWDDAGNHYKMNFPQEVLAALAGAVAQVQAMPITPPPPAVVVPGGRARLPDGSVISLGAGGEVYRDAVQLPGVAARQAVQVGLHLYAQGKTTPSWWSWTGSTWVAVTKFDPAILADLPVASTLSAPASAVKRR